MTKHEAVFCQTGFLWLSEPNRLAMFLGALSNCVASLTKIVLATRARDPENARSAQHLSDP